MSHQKLDNSFAFSSFTPLAESHPFPLPFPSLQVRSQELAVVRLPNRQRRPGCSPRTTCPDIQRWTIATLSSNFALRLESSRQYLHCYQHLERFNSGRKKLQYVTNMATIPARNRNGIDAFQGSSEKATYTPSTSAARIA